MSITRAGIDTKLGFENKDKIKNMIDKMNLCFFPLILLMKNKIDSKKTTAGKLSRSGKNIRYCSCINWMNYKKQ